MRHHLLTALLLAPALAAQSRGPVLAMPSGFSIDPATTLLGGSADRLELDDSGIDGALPPRRVPGGAIPDWDTFLGGAAVDVDAMSLGLDWIVSNPLGEAVVGPMQWAGLTYSVSRATIGAPGTVIAREAATANGAAGDVFGYIIPGSAFTPALVGLPFRSKDSSEIADFTPSVPNIDAHDLFISLIYQENPALAALLPPPTLYFSVTDATVAAIPAAWLTVPLSASGATVFATTWLPASGAWTPPVVAFPPAALGLDPTEDLDAFAYDPIRATALLSTDPLLPPPLGPPRNPVLWTALGSGVNSPYVLPAGGGDISDELGLGIGTDDIDGICSLDPGSAPAPSPIFLPAMMGTVEQPLPIGPLALDAALWRRTDSIGNQFASTTMTGWPTPGVPQLGFAISAASLSGPFGPYILLDAFVRDPIDPFEGNPQRTEVLLPPTLLLSGLPIHFVWGALDNNVLAFSAPVGMVL